MGTIVLDYLSLALDLYIYQNTSRSAVVRHEWGSLDDASEPCLIIYH